MALTTLYLLINHLKSRLTPEQQKIFKCNYSELKNIPKEIRDLIIKVALGKNFQPRLMYEQCGITDIEDMINNITILLYLEINVSD